MQYVHVRSFRIFEINNNQQKGEWWAPPQRGVFADLKITMQHVYNAFTDYFNSETLSEASRMQWRRFQQILSLICRCSCCWRHHVKYSCFAPYSKSHLFLSLWCLKVRTGMNKGEDFEAWFCGIVVAFIAMLLHYCIRPPHWTWIEGNILIACLYSLFAEKSI